MKHPNHYDLQKARVQRLLLFADRRLGNIVRLEAWLILREECGGFWRFVRWGIENIYTNAKIDLQMFWRLKIRKMDPEDDATWQ